MSWLDGFIDDAEAVNLDNRYQRTDKLPEPGVWQNFGGALMDSGELGVRVGMESLASGLTNLAGSELGSVLATGFGAGYTPGFDAESYAESAAAGADELTDRIGRSTAEAVDELRPNPQTTGMAGQILGGLAEVIPRYAVGALAGGPIGGAIAAGAPQGYAATQVAKSQGIDDSTAIGQGLIEGAVTTVGAAMPGARLLKSVPADLAAVAGANVGLGVAGRAATAELLEQRGYTAQAAQYKAFDTTSIILDATLGLAFGAAGRAGDIRASFNERLRPTVEQVDAALTEKNSQHYELDAAPGIPTTPEAAAAHRSAMDEAVDLLRRDEPVRLSQAIDESAYLSRKPDHETLAEEVSALPEIHRSPTADISAPPKEGSQPPEILDDPELQKPSQEPTGGEQVTAAAGEQSEQSSVGSGQTPGDGRAPAETPTQALGRAAGETPDSIVNVGEDGAPVYRSLAQAFDEIDVERARAEVDSRAYQAAINCALRRGD
ncbi:hypothetical protein [Pseudomonas solani]|uniref:hypothetical protein n=1 Tax=Pseudomonas solani TaxID=2731552 RepID=UPI003D6A9FE5